MFPTPPDSPDGPSDTRGRGDGRETRSSEVGRGRRKSKEGKGSKGDRSERIFRGKRKILGGKSLRRERGGMGSAPESPDSSVAAVVRRDGLSSLGSGLVCLPSICFLFRCGHPEACLSNEHDWRRRSAYSAIRIHTAMPTLPLWAAPAVYLH